MTQPFCRDCTRARLSAEGKLYTCLFAVQGSDLRAVLRDGSTDAEVEAFVRGVWSGAIRPLLGAPVGSDVDTAADRDVRDGRLTRRSMRRPQGYPQPGEFSGQRRRRSGAIWWITALTGASRPPNVGLARRGRQERRTRDHIKDSSFHRRSLRALRCPRRAARLTTARRPGPRPTGRDRHPGVDTSVGPTKPRASAVYPLDAILEARMSHPTRPYRPVPSDRPGRSAGADRRAGGGRPSADGPGARGRDRPRIRARRPGGRRRGRRRDPVRGATGLAGRHRPGHAGRLLLGRLGGRVVVMLQGRFHLYEGNHPGLVIQPVLLFRALGASVVVLTNAAGGLDPSFGPGTLMVMSDHINLTGMNPLIGPERGWARRAVPRHDRGVEPAPSRAPCEPPATPRVSSWRRASTSASPVRPTRPRPRSGCWRRSAVMRSGCPRSSNASPLAGWGWRCAASRSSRTPAPGYSGEPLTPRGGHGGRVAIAGPRLAKVIRRFVTDLTTA